MQKVSFKPKRHTLDSFTLVELLAVVAIIAILASLTLAGANAVWSKAARSRASAEIQAMSTALESYKTDNGVYPTSTNLFGPGTSASGAYPVSPTGFVAASYPVSSQILFQALTGKTNFMDPPIAGTKVYMTFKANQLGNTTTAANTAYAMTTATYIKDPWGYSYGYSTGGNPLTTYYPYNGSGFFDLWSTGGILADNGTTYATNSWVNNWSGN